MKKKTTFSCGLCRISWGVRSIFIMLLFGEKDFSAPSQQLVLNSSFHKTLGRKDLGKIVFLCLKIELRAGCSPAHFSCLCETDICELWKMSDGRREEIVSASIRRLDSILVEFIRTYRHCCAFILKKAIVEHTAQCFHLVTHQANDSHRWVNFCSQLPREHGSNSSC